MSKFRRSCIVPLSGLAGVFLLVGVATVVILALLGPAVGNVFSNIVSDCSNCGGVTSPGYGAAYQPREPYPSYGGTDPVNGEPYADMFFEHSGVNPFIDTEDDLLSTFALDVDTGSYTVARSYLKDGYLPPEGAVRVEEFVNYFDYDLPAPQEGTFAITLDGGPTPFVQNDHYQVLRVGIQGMQIPETEREDAVLVFVVDTSGSMAEPVGSAGYMPRIELLRTALVRLVETLQPSDQVGIVAFGETARVVLPVTPAGERGAILDAIYRLQPSGSTNAAAGIELGYQMASRAYRPGAMNRVILCSDGVANTGLTGASDILAQVQRYTEQEIYLSTVGVGMGNYNDVLLERLADEGNGAYSYVDSVDQAEKVFVEDLTGLLQTIALDAKVQVTFNPKAVSRYRLLGYENRSLRDDQFHDPSVDAGDIGSGHSVTALYELKLVSGGRGPIADVALRWEDPNSHEVHELTESIALDELSPSFEQTTDSFKLAVLVAQYAEILRGSYWAQERSLGDLTGWLHTLDGMAAEDAEVQEFVWLVDQAASLEGGR